MTADPEPMKAAELALHEAVEAFMDRVEQGEGPAHDDGSEDELLAAIEEALIDRLDGVDWGEIGREPITPVDLGGLASRLSDDSLLAYEYEREDASEITDADRVAYARRIMIGIIQEGHADADQDPTHLVVPFNTRSGKEVLLGACVTGYSFTEIRWEFTGVFSSVCARDRELLACGLLLSADDVTNLADHEILAHWQRPQLAPEPQPRIRRSSPATRRDGVKADRYGVLRSWTPRMPGVRHVHAILDRLQEVHQWTVIGLTVTGLGVKEYLGLERDAIVERFRVFERGDWDEPSRNVPPFTMTSFQAADAIVRGADLPAVWIPPTMTPYLYASIPARTTYGDLLQAWRHAAAEIGAPDSKLSHLKQLRRYCVGDRQTAPGICALAERLHGWQLGYDQARRMSLRVVS